MDEIATKQQLSDSLKLMAAFFYEPETELFEEENVCRNLSNIFQSFCPEACISVDDMCLALQNSSQKELQIAHAELFVGPFGLKASSYGSTYLEKTRMVMGKSTMEVLKHYETVGLEVDIKQPPDHIAIELEFLSYLCGLEAEALQGGVRKKGAELAAEQKSFLGAYVLPWMPQFVENIRSGTENTFYLCLAECFEKFLRQLTVLYKDTDSYSPGVKKLYVDATIH